jgi:hypothetical protein
VNDVYISNVKVDTQADSVVISDIIEERSICNFTVLDLNNQFTFKKGMPVHIKNNLQWGQADVAWGQATQTWGDEITYYKGWIDKVVKTEPYSDGVFYHRISCVDSHYLADKRIIAKAYENERVGDIVKDIIETYLEDEGITEGVIEDGSIAIEAVFNYIPATDAFNSLAEKSGFWWRIDNDRKLHFRARAGNQAPYNISNDIVIMKGSIDVENSNGKYRNKQYVKGSKDITDPQDEIKFGDGENQTFTVGYPVAKAPTIQIDIGAGYISQTVGIRSIDTGKNWYWSKGDNAISQDSGGTPLGATDKIKITYQGEFDVVVVTFDEDLILERQETEEIGTGIVEDVFDDRNLTGRESAFDVANAKLKKYSEISQIVRIITPQRGFEVGQIVNVNLPKYSINNEEFLISKVEIFSEDRGRSIFYAIECLKGVNNQTWAKFFYDLATKSREFVIRENISEQQVLVTLQELSKDWEATESPNIFTSTVAGETTLPSATTLPMFSVADRVKYIAWYVGGVENGRKPIAKRINSTSEIFTLSYLSPLDANVNISHLGFYGGIKATSTIGTGVEIDKQVYVKNKTELESVQVEKTDTNIDSPVATGLELTPTFLNDREQDIFELNQYAENQMAIVIANSL